MPKNEIISARVKELIKKGVEEAYAELWARAELEEEA